MQFIAVWGELKVERLMEQVRDSQDDVSDYANNAEVEDQSYKEGLVQEDSNTRETTELKVF